MAAQFTAAEKRVLYYLKDNGETAQSAIATGIQMDPGELSRVVDSLQQKGAVEVRKEGTTNMISLAQGVEFEGQEVSVPEGITFPLVEKFQFVLDRVLKGKIRGNISLMIENFKANPNYQTPQGMRALLTNWQIDPLSQNVIIDTVFPGSMTSAGPWSGWPSGDRGGVSYYAGPGGMPILVLGSGQGQQSPFPGGPIIIQPQQNPPPGGGQQGPIIIETKEKRRVTRPVTTEKGEIVKVKQGEKCPFCGGDTLCEQVEEPVTVQVGPQGSKSASQELSDVLTVLKSHNVIGGQQNPGPTEREKDLQKRVEEAEKRAEEAKETLRKKELEDLRKEMKEGQEGIVALIQKNRDEDKREGDHKREVDRLTAERDAARSTGASTDERLIDKGVDKLHDKVIGGTLKDIYELATRQGGRSLQPPTGPATTAAEAEAELKRRLGA